MVPVVLVLVKDCPSAQLLCADEMTNPNGLVWRLDGMTYLLPGRHRESELCKPESFPRRKLSGLVFNEDMILAGSVPADESSSCWAFDAVRRGMFN